MSHERASDEILERAALYALDLLDPDEAHAFERHLEEGCPVCELEVRTFRETAAQLPAALPEMRPASRIREQLLERVRSGPQVWKEWNETPAVPLHVVRGDPRGWESVGLDGVWVKRLYVDPARDTATMLVRMAPGAYYPAHRHGGPEQCFVLEGDLRVGDLVLQAGDYQCAASESLHDVTTTEHGCLLLIVSSLQDKLMAY